MECDGGSRVFALADHFYLSQRLSFGIFLLVDLAFPVDFSHEAVRQRVHAGYTDTVKTSGHLVAVLVELTAGMENRKNHLESRPVLFRVHSRRDSSSVILDSDGVVFQY